LFIDIFLILKAAKLLGLDHTIQLHVGTKRRDICCCLKQLI